MGCTPIIAVTLQFGFMKEPNVEAVLEDMARPNEIDLPLQLLFDRYGILPRHLIFVEVAHREVPYTHDGRYGITVFHEDRKSSTRREQSSGSPAPREPAPVP